MEFKQIKNDSDIKEYDKYTRQEANVENARKWLSEYLNNDNFSACVEAKTFDSFIVDAFFMYQAKLEKDIRDYIKRVYNQDYIPVGTEINLTKDFSEKYQKGYRTKITKTTRFDEDTFGNGWYRYETTDGLVLYGFEFEVA